MLTSLFYVTGEFHKFLYRGRAIFWTFWRFSAGYGPNYSSFNLLKKANWQHNSMSFFQSELCFTTFLLGHDLRL